MRASERRSCYVTLPWQHRILKSCSQKFTDHFNAIWYQVQVTEATNRFTLQIVNSWLKSWPDLTTIPLSETCELGWAIFAFATLFSSWNMMHQPNHYRRGCRINTDRAIEGASFQRGPETGSPRKFFGFSFLKVPFPGFHSHSDRILARFQPWKYFYYQKYICYEKCDRFP